MDPTTKNLFDVIFQGIQLCVVLGTAGWAIIRFGKENPLYPRIEFDVKCDFLGPQIEVYLAAVTITASNKGSIEHRFRKIGIEVRGIPGDDALSARTDYPHLIRFPNEIARIDNIVPAKDGYYFVRPGVSQTFNYAVQVPASIRFIRIKATFIYQSGEDEHTAQKIYEVKPT